MVNDKSITKRGIGLYFQTILNIDLSEMDEMKDDNIHSLFDLISKEKITPMTAMRLSEIHNIFGV